MAGRVRFDDDGFMTDPRQWSPDVAADIAREEGISHLSRDHLALLQALRRLYLGQGGVPAMRHVCREAGLEEQCVTELLEDPRRAWRIAGLPNPGEEAKAYLESAEQATPTGDREREP